MFNSFRYFLASPSPHTVRNVGIFAKFTAQFSKILSNFRRFVVPTQNEIPEGIETMPQSKFMSKVEQGKRHLLKRMHIYTEQFSQFLKTKPEFCRSAQN